MIWSEEKVNSFKILVRSFYDYQRERMRLDGRLGITKAGDIKKKVPPRDDSFLGNLWERREQVLAQEQALFKVIATEVHTHSLWIHFLDHVKGVGETIAAVLLSEVDIYKAPMVSNIVSFAGLAPGKDRKVKGQKCPYNQFLRSKLCGVLGPSFLKSKSPYTEEYYNVRHRLESMDWGEPSKNPTDPKKPKAGHQHNAAIRKMIKRFIADLYVAWRTLEGLSVREPYAEEYLGKKHGEHGVA